MRSQLARSLFGNLGLTLMEFPSAICSAPGQADRCKIMTENLHLETIQAVEQEQTFADIFPAPLGHPWRTPCPSISALGNWDAWALSLKSSLGSAVDIFNVSPTLYL